MLLSLLDMRDRIDDLRERLGAGLDVWVVWLLIVLVWIVFLVLESTWKTMTSPSRPTVDERQSGAP